MKSQKNNGAPHPETLLPKVIINNPELRSSAKIVAPPKTPANETLGPADKTLQLRTPQGLKNRVQKIRARLVNVLGITILAAGAGSAGYMVSIKDKEEAPKETPSTVPVQTQEAPEVDAPILSSTNEELPEPAIEEPVEPDDAEKNAKAAPSASAEPVAPVVKPAPRPFPRPRTNSGGIIREVPF